VSAGTFLAAWISGTLLGAAVHAALWWRFVRHHPPAQATDTTTQVGKGGDHG